MNVKSLFLLTFLTVITVSIHAQCKFRTNEADPFTSEKHMVTKDVKLNGDMKTPNEAKFYAITNLELLNKVFRWNFNFFELSMRDKNSPEAAKLRIKTKEGIIEVVAGNIPDPKYTIEEYLKMTELDYYFELTEEQMKMMAKGVELVGMEIFGENKLFKINSLEDITNYAKCMSE